MRACMEENGMQFSEDQVGILNRQSRRIYNICVGILHSIRIIRIHPPYMEHTANIILRKLGDKQSR